MRKEGEIGRSGRGGEGRGRFMYRLEVEARGER